jgi:hypothetical protein
MLLSCQQLQESNQRKAAKECEGFTNQKADEPHFDLYQHLPLFGNTPSVGFADLSRRESLFDLR